MARFGIDDERAQSIQIGALLLFAILIVSLSLYQTTAVPSQNEQVEFNHNEQVQDRLVDLRNSVRGTATTGGGQSVSIPLGTRYPNRGVFINPAPAAGGLRTVGTDSSGVAVRVANAEATTGETRDRWNGTYAPNGPGDVGYFETGSVEYDPAYNYYGNAPTTVIENSIAYNEFPNGEVGTLTEQSLVDGRRITLVTLAGNYSEAGTASASVDLDPVSAPAEEVAVRNATGERVNVTVATRLEESVWLDLLDDQLNQDVSSCEDTVPTTNEDTSDGAYVTACNYTDNGEFSNLTLVMEQGATYTLRLGRVGVGNVDEEDGAAYITAPGSDTVSVPANVSVTLTAEVRDRYDNPVSGEDVTASPAADLDRATETSDEAGRVDFVYTAPSGAGGETKTVTAKIDGGGADAKTVTFTVNVQTNGGVGGGGGGGGDGSFGAGRTSDYGDGDTETVSVPNGKWDNVTVTDELVVSDGVTVSDSDDPKKEELRLSVTLRNATTDYVVELDIKRKGKNGEFETKKVRITEITDGNTDNQNKALTVGAARRLFNATAYNGTDLLDVSNYQGDDLAPLINSIREMHSSNVTIVTNRVQGRADLTVRTEALFTAVEPHPDDRDDFEFVRLNFENATDTTGWTLEREGGGTATLPSATIDGTVYLATNETGFENERGFDDDVVYPLGVDLADPGSALTLIDGQGRIRDEVAYVSGTAETPDTSHGWNVENVNEGTVAVRKVNATGFGDNETAGDWRTTDQFDFFGLSGPAVAYTSSSNTNRVNVTDESGTVASFGVASPGVNTLGPKTDVDGDGDDEVPYIDSNNNDLQYMESDGTVVTITGAEPDADRSIGVGNRDGNSMTNIYYVDSGELYVVEADGNGATQIQADNPETMNPNERPVDAIGVYGNADFDDDGNVETVYQKNSTTLGYVNYDGVQNTLTFVDVDASLTSPARALGEPLTLDGETQVAFVDGNSNVSVVNSTGTVTHLVNGNSGPKAASAPLAPIDWDEDGDVEIVFINSNDNQQLYYVDTTDDSVTAVDAGDTRLRASTKGVR